MIIKENSNPQKFSVLIPDGQWDKLTNQVINCFSQNEEVSLYVMSNRKFISSRYSKYISGYIYDPITTDASIWIDNLNSAVKNFKIDLILPVYEDALEILIKNRELIQEQTKLVNLPSIISFNTAREKKKLAHHLTKNGIPGPKSYIHEKDLNLLKVITHYPILCKPIEGFSGGLGILKFDDETTLMRFLEKDNIDYSKMIFQEFIHGYDIDCSVLCREGTIEAYTIQRGILYGKNKFSPPIGVKFVHEFSLLKVVQELMRSLNWNGVAHVDLRYDIKNDEYKVIEVNCRFWTSLEASLEAGVNFPYLYCLTSLNMDFDKPNYNHISFFSFKGILKKIRIDPGSLFKYNLIWKYSPLKFMVKDPLPVLAKIIHRFKIILFKH